MNRLKEIDTFNEVKKRLNKSGPPGRETPEFEKPKWEPREKAKAKAKPKAEPPG